jgi:hypothetical protein
MQSYEAISSLYTVLSGSTCSLTVPSRVLPATSFFGGFSNYFPAWLNDADDWSLLTIPAHGATSAVLAHTSVISLVYLDRRPSNYRSPSASSKRICLNMRHAVL